MLRLLPLFLGAAVLAQSAPTVRKVVVIGDLHMGPGLDSTGAWHAVEDFRWRDEFVRFLEALSAEGAATDLVINGDLFELLQSPEIPCAYADGVVGCTENDARLRLLIASKRTPPGWQPLAKLPPP